MPLHQALGLNSGSDVWHAIRRQRNTDATAKYRLKAKQASHLHIEELPEGADGEDRTAQQLQSEADEVLEQLIKQAKKNSSGKIKVNVADLEKFGKALRADPGFGG